ncbi:MAG: outer membrane homotrimeric porin [Proteobacteria bacterium]|nr:outer membrane homotrimeric porin [Pseudomonadota bacterium]
MKKIGVLGLVAFLLLATASMSFALEIKAKGYWWIESVMKNNWDFLGKGAASGEDKTFNIEQKMRTQFHFIANENLRAVFDTQIGSSNWGNGLYSIGAGRSAGTQTAGQAPAGSGSNANAAGAGNIMLRQGYMEYRWPSTLVNFKVGFQTLSLPSAFGGGSPILDDQVAAAVVSAPITGNVSLLVGYARPFDSNSNAFTTASNISGGGTSTDIVFAAVPVSFKGATITPFAAYAHAGADTYAPGVGAPGLAGFMGPNSSGGQGLRSYWGGVAATVTALDNFKFMGDFNYGKATYNNPSANDNKAGRQGFMFDAAVDYTGLSMMTPQVFFTYSSGENGNSSKGGTSERMPVVGAPQFWTIGSFFFGERLELGGSINNSAGYTSNTLGYWAAGISLKDMTFVDKLSHTFNLLYARGTNDKKYIYETGGTIRNANYGGFLTTEDSLWEVDLNSRYKIYDELTLLVYLGYINANFDKDVWGDLSTVATTASAATAADIKRYGSSNAYKVGVGLNYFF